MFSPNFVTSHVFPKLPLQKILTTFQIEGIFQQSGCYRTAEIPNCSIIPKLLKNSLDLKCYKRILKMHSKMNSQKIFYDFKKNVYGDCFFFLSPLAKRINL